MLTKEAWIVILFTLLVNLPFGYWRAGTRRLSVQWFVAVHTPILAIATLRVVIELGWRWSLLPFTIAAYFTGQFLGGRLRRLVSRLLQQ